MADNSYNIMVSNPVTPFTMARSFKACSNGKIFIGKPDTDPTFPENQIPVYVENECGNTVQVPQPIVINTAGYPVYHGQVAKFVTTQNYSMAVYDSYMVQQFYWGNLSKLDPESLVKMQYIPYRTLEYYGGGTDIDDNSTALQAFFDDAECSVLRLGIGTYKLKKPVLCKRNITIIGYGTQGTFSDASSNNVYQALLGQTSGSVLLDARTSDSDDWLITTSDNTGYAVSNIQFRDFAVVGANELGCPTPAKTRGFLPGHISWNSVYSNLIFSGFGKEAIGPTHADAIWNDIQVLRSGGLVNGTVYYAVDTVGASGNPNFNVYNNIHIEHCRYALSAGGMFNQFIGGHIELNNESFTPSTENSPIIRLKKVRQHLVFDRMKFVAPYYSRWLDGYDVNGDLAANFASIPYFISGSDADIAGTDATQCSVSFLGCSTQVGNSQSSAAKWIDVPVVKSIISNCYFGRTAQFTRSIKVAANSLVSNNYVQIFPISSDSSAYSAYTVGVVSPIISGYGDFSASNVTFKNGGAPGYAAFEVVSGGTNSRFIGIDKSAFGYTFKNYAGDYVAGTFYADTVWGNSSVTSAGTGYFAGQLTANSTLIINGSRVEFGPTNAAASPYWDFHSSGNNIDYDVRMLVSGGGTSIGGGILTFTGGTLNLGFSSGVSVGGNFTPGQDSAFSNGSASRRWTQFFAVNSSIGTSNAEKKTTPRDVLSNEATAFLQIAELPWVWQWLEKYQVEGDDARLHSGPTVQAAIEIMTANGLDWTKYSAFCYDKWDAVEEVSVELPEEIDPDTGEVTKQASTVITTPGSEAGEDYGFRKEELLLWISKAILLKQKDIESRLVKLESS